MRSNTISKTDNNGICNRLFIRKSKYRRRTKQPLDRRARSTICLLSRSSFENNKIAFGISQFFFSLFQFFSFSFFSLFRINFQPLCATQFNNAKSQLKQFFIQMVHFFLSKYFSFVLFYIIFCFSLYFFQILFNSRGGKRSGFFIEIHHIYLEFVVLSNGQ